LQAAVCVTARSFLERRFSSDPQRVVFPRPDTWRAPKKGPAIFLFRLTARQELAEARWTIVQWRRVQPQLG